MPSDPQAMLRIVFGWEEICTSAVIVGFSFRFSSMNRNERRIYKDVHALQACSEALNVWASINVEKIQ